MANTMIAPVTNIRELVTVQRSRLLPADGLVFPEMDQRLAARDVIAKSNFGNQHMLLDAGTALGTSPKRAATFLQREVGEDVEKGAILAGKRGIAARTLRAPVDGRVVAISGAQILLQVTEQSANLYACMSGRVISIIPSRGVILEFIGSWIEGAWGNGAFDDGALHMLSENADHSLVADDLDMSLRGSILLAGHCGQRQALEMAAQIPIRGLILGSLATRLLPLAQATPYPILLTEGFGEIPMNSAAFKLLAGAVNEIVTVNAQLENQFEDLHPEVFIPIENAGIPPKSIEAQSFRIGLKVRILSEPHAGEIGEISAMLPSSTLFPSGIRAPGAEIVLKDGSASVLPLANLEVLG